MSALAAFKNKLKCAWAAKEDQKDEKKESVRDLNQNDLLATRRTDLVEDDEDDDDAENRSDAWMTNQLKFVRHFEVCLRFLLNLLF